MKILRNFLLIISIVAITNMKISVIGVDADNCDSSESTNTTIHVTDESTEAIETETDATNNSTDETNDPSDTSDQLEENTAEVLEDANESVEDSTELDDSTPETKQTDCFELETEKSTEISTGNAIEKEPEPTTEVETRPSEVTTTEPEAVEVPTTEEIIEIELIDMDNYSTIRTFNGLNEQEYMVITDLLLQYQRYKNGEVDKVEMVYETELKWSSYYQLESWFGVYLGCLPQDDFIDMNLNASRKITTVTLRIETFESYLAKREEMLAMIGPILEKLQEGDTDYKLMQISNWLATHIVYTSGQTDAYTALLTGKGNCNAYAQLFQLMASRLGITCDLCIGYSDTGRHAWNRVTQMKEGTGMEYTYYDMSYSHYGRNAKWVNQSNSPWNVYKINNWWN